MWSNEHFGELWAEELALPGPPNSLELILRWEDRRLIENLLGRCMTSCIEDGISRVAVEDVGEAVLRPDLKLRIMDGILYDRILKRTRLV